MQGEGLYDKGHHDKSHVGKFIIIYLVLLWYRLECPNPVCWALDKHMARDNPCPEELSLNKAHKGWEKKQRSDLPRLSNTAFSSRIINRSQV